MGGRKARRKQAGLDLSLLHCPGEGSAAPDAWAKEFFQSITAWWEQSRIR